jgi:hypothetical protein
VPADKNQENRERLLKMSTLLNLHHDNGQMEIP